MTRSVGVDGRSVVVDGRAVDVGGGAIPDATVAQFESSGSDNLSVQTPYSVIAVAAFDNDESGDIWSVTLSDGNTMQLTDKGGFDLNLTSGYFADLVYGTVSDSGLVIITTTFPNSGDSKIFVNGTVGEQDALAPPDLDGEFIADNGYTNTFEETLVYNEDIDPTGLRTDEEQRLADKYNITL